MRYCIAAMAAIVMAALVLQFGCRDKSTNPPPPKNPREYVWEAREIYIENSQTFMKGIWGASSSDIWIVGGVGTTGTFGTINHFDGKTIRPIAPPFPEEPYANYELQSVYGFARDNIWAVGAARNFSQSRAAILHYDGKTWRDVAIPRGEWLYDVWGSSANNVWACGHAGSLYHFSGSSWTKVPFDSSTLLLNMWGPSSGQVYAIGWKLPLDLITPTYRLYQYNGTSWVIADTFQVQNNSPEHKFGIDGIWGIDESNIFSVGDRVYRKTTTGWEVLLDTGKPFYEIAGLSASNIFVVGYPTQIYHFDGKSWFGFSNTALPSVILLDVVVFEREVFAVGWDGWKSYLLHGK